MDNKKEKEALQKEIDGEAFLLASITNLSDSELASALTNAIVLSEHDPEAELLCRLLQKEQDKRQGGVAKEESSLEDFILKQLSL
jgi:hypothetical protein